MSRSSILIEVHRNFKPLNAFFTLKCTKPLLRLESKATLISSPPPMLVPKVKLRFGEKRRRDGIPIHAKGTPIALMTNSGNSRLKDGGPTLKPTTWSINQ